MNKGKKILITIAAIIVLAMDSKADDMFGYADIRSYTMGKCFAAIESIGNPVGFSISGTRKAALNYINRYGMKELSTYSGFINIPTKQMNLGAYVSHYGMNSYNENKFSLIFNRNLSKHIALGIRVNYHLWQMHYRENNVHAVTADIGLLITPTEKLTIGAVFNNPVRKGIIKGKSDIKLPVMIAAGMSYKPVSTLLLTLEVEKSVDENTYFKFGTEYSPIPELDIRVGVIGKPFIPTFGFGLNLGKFTVNAGAKYHTSLGLEYLCGVEYRF